MHRRLALAAAAACLTFGGPAATAAPAQDLQPRPWLSVSDGGSSAAAELIGHRSSFSSLEDPVSEASGLPAAEEHIELVSELSPAKFGAIRTGEIADLAVYKGYAYLNSWDGPQCDRGGTYVVDIRDVTKPKEVAYIPPIQPFYHGEGAHALGISTPAFTGDILAVNDETWGSNVRNSCGPADTSQGGFDLYDVSDPTNPKVLVQGAGDRDADTPDDPSDDLGAGNSYHSVFAWQAGPRAYLAASDNIELQDVDIFDITNPRAPVQVADLDLADEFPQILDNEKANGAAVFNHDMVVKKIGDRYVMSVSNWDAGYVQIDVTDPAHPTYVTDTTTGPDAYRPSLFGEGNAHESEFSFDNQFLLAADEDFAPYRSVLTGATTGKTRSAVEGGDNPKQIADLPDGRLNGPSVWSGTGCDPATFPPAPADDGDPATDRIALVERGGCGFADKFDNAAAAGYEGLVIFNQPRPDDGQVNMLTAGGPDGLPATIPGVHMRRVDALGPEGALTTATTAPAAGTAGPNVSIGVVFDGWGYTHLYDAKTSQLIDSYAVPESQDPRFANGFGDLSVHEFATDPTEPVAYAAWYGAGLRTFRFSRADGLVPTGKWIDDDGNGSNFWGVEVFSSNGERYVAASDRDYGLQIFRYTGAGRAERPVCSDSSLSTEANTPVLVPLTCTDANTQNTLTYKIVTAPGGGTLGDIVDGKVAYNPRAGFAGTDTFTFVANDGALDSAPATVSVTVAREEPSYYVSKRKPRLTARARPKRDPRKPFAFRVDGKLIRPTGVDRADGCKGTVVIKAKKGRRVIGKRRTGIKSTCKYKARVKLRNSAGRRGKVKFQVTYLGSDVLFGARAKATARYGKKK